MATSIYGSTNHPSGRVEVCLTWWERDVNVAANYSVIEVQLWAHRTDGYVSTGTSNMQIGITGTWSRVFGGVYSIGADWVLIGQDSKIIYHADDGSFGAWIEGYGGLTDIGWTSMSVGGYANLSTIPRTSQISGPNYITAGSQFTIQSNRKSSSFWHCVWVNVKGQWLWVDDNYGMGDSGTYTCPMSLLSAMPNEGATLNAFIGLETYTWPGKVKIGESRKFVTFYAPESVVPTLSGMTVGDPSGTFDQIGAYVQNISTARVVLGANAGVYGSTIKEQKTQVGSSIKSGEVGDHLVTTSGSQEVLGWVTDSRGRWTQKTATINVLPYTPPTVTKMAIERCQSDGTPDTLGTYLKVSSAGTGSSLKNGTTEKNVLGYKIVSKKRGSQDWIVAKSVTLPGMSWDTTDVIGGSFSTTESFDIQVLATDVFNTAVSQSTAATGRVTMAWGRTAVGIGKIPEEGREGLDLAGDLWVNGVKISSLSAAVPGEVKNGTDLNNYITPGWYLSAETPTDLVNSPTGATGFAMRVEPLPNGLSQSIMTNSGKSCSRTFLNNVWSKWKDPITASLVGDPMWGRVGNNFVTLSGQRVNTTNGNGELRIIHNGNLVGVMSAQFSTGDTNAYRGYIGPATGDSWIDANNIWAQTTVNNGAVRANYLIMGWTD